MTSFPVKASYDTNQKETMSPKGDAGVFGKIHSNLKTKNSFPIYRTIQIRFPPLL